jgi:hypothetical protein
MAELNKQMLEVLGVKNIGKLIPTEDTMKPKDPVAENMAILNGKPVKAFLTQDHQAHIQVHMSAMQDPKIMQIVGQNPQAQMIQAAAMAHINEHVAFEYRKQIEQQLGTELPPMDEELTPEMENQISGLQAQAAQQLLQKDQAEASQQQAQQQQQDPLVQMQQKELQLKEQDLQIKAQKTMADIQAEQTRLELDKMRIESQERIAGATHASKVMLENTRLTLDKDAKQMQQMIDGAKFGAEQVHKNAQEKIQLEQIKTQKDQQKPKE